LTLADELSFGSDDCLEEIEVLDVTSMRLDAMDEMLDDFVTDFSTQRCVILKDGAASLRLDKSRSEEEVEVFVKQRLIGLVPTAKVLKELVG
jgi:hypothetical protein